MEQLKEFETIQELLQTQQYTRLRQLLVDLNDADIAACMEELPEQSMVKAFRILPKDLAADIFSYLEVDLQQTVITSLTDREAASIIDNLMADDAVDLLEEMPANVVKRLLENASPETRRDINHLLRYPEDSAGSIMTVEYVDLKESLTVEGAIARIRAVGLDSETINICYVLDAQRKLLGTVALRYLLLSQPDETIGEIMHENVVSVHTHADQEEVARQYCHAGGGQREPPGGDHHGGRYRGRDRGRGHGGYGEDGGAGAQRQALYADFGLGDLQKKDSLAAPSDGIRYLHRQYHHFL